jgi:hypothetical protein
MANHNELKRISTTPNPNSIPYADESGFITSWLNDDPLISSLKSQNQFIGNVNEIPSGEDLQSYLSNFVITTVSRNPRNGDEVGILDQGELWIFSGTFGDDGVWMFFSETSIGDASTTEKGVMQVGTGLLVNSGLVSVDSSIYWASRMTNTITSTTPTIALAANTDYVCSNALTSLTLTTIPNSSYYTTITFTTGSTFTYTATNLTQYYFSSSTPTFEANTTYKLVVVNGKCHIYYIGARKYPVNKLTASNPALTATDNIVTWTITNTLNSKDVIIRVYDTLTGATVEADSTITLSTITIKLYTDLATVSAATYTAVILG